MGYAVQSIGQWQAWVPTFTGFSADPTSVTARYTLSGKMCTAYFFATSGTSNATTFTITLPFAAANVEDPQTFAGNVVDNGTGKVGIVRTRVNSNVLDVYNGATGTAFTASGAKNAAFSITYEIA